MEKEILLEAAHRYVREGEQHVQRQTEILAELKARGANTEQVEQALYAASALLRVAREHLAAQERSARQ